MKPQEPDLPNLAEMDELSRLRWLVANMTDTTTSRAARSGLLWKCPACHGAGRVGTGKTETYRKRPGDPGYLPGYPMEYDPDQYEERAVYATCALCRGVGRLDHQPVLEQVVTPVWR